MLTNNHKIDFLFTLINKYLTVYIMLIILYLIINIVYNKEKPRFIGAFDT